MQYAILNRERSHSDRHWYYRVPFVRLPHATPVFAISIATYEIDLDRRNRRYDILAHHILAEITLLPQSLAVYSQRNQIYCMILLFVGNLSPLNCRNGDWLTDIFTHFIEISSLWPIDHGSRGKWTCALQYGDGQAQKCTGSKTAINSGNNKNI